MMNAKYWLRCILSFLVLFPYLAWAQTSTSMPFDQAINQARDQGYLTSEAQAAFFDHAVRCAKNAVSMPDDFWNWLDTQPVIRQGLLATLYPNFTPKVFICLNDLRNIPGGVVNRYPHLALAFALVYGQAGDGTLRAPWMAWVAKGREVPTMAEAFVWYVQNASKMRFALKNTPWPLLIHLADNDIPIIERDWVMDRYGVRPFAELRTIHSEPDYSHVGAKKAAQQPGMPMALPRILREGGVCSQKAYFQTAVLKTLGVPAIRVLVPGHAYSGWMEEKPVLTLPCNARDGIGPVTYYPCGKHRHGTYFCPRRRKNVGQHEFELTVAAMKCGYPSYLRELVALRLYEMASDGQKSNAGKMLEVALQANPFFPDAWTALAEGCRRKNVPLTEGDRLLILADRKLMYHPAMICKILEMLMPPRIVDENADPSQVDADLKTLQRELARFKELGRDDLTTTVRNLIGTHVATHQNLSAAVDLYAEWLKETDYALWYRKLLEHCMGLEKNKSKESPVLALLRTELKRLPAPTTETRKMKAQIDARRGCLLKKIRPYLREVGLGNEARALRQGREPATQPADTEPPVD